MKRIFLAIIAAIWMIAAAQAQIGYKGQLSLELLPGITHRGGLTGAIRIGAFLSDHSNIGVGVRADYTIYDAVHGDSFNTSQWIGELDYRYAFPLSRFIFMPGAGVFFGAEQCDSISKLGNILTYGDQVIYGAGACVGIEYVLSRSWALEVEPRIHYLLRTHFDNLKLSINFGIKCYF